MEKNGEENMRSSADGIKINVFDKTRENDFVISPVGKGRSYYADFLRKENPDLTIVEIEMQPDIESLENREPESYSKMNKELTDELLKEASEVLQGCTGVILDHDQLLALIDSDPQLCFSLVLNGPNDTEVRGDLASALSEELIGKSWGTYGDNDFDIDQFLKQLHAAAINQGYQVDSEN